LIFGFDSKLYHQSYYLLSTNIHGVIPQYQLLKKNIKISA